MQTTRLADGICMAILPLGVESLIERVDFLLDGCIHHMANGDTDSLTHSLAEPHLSNGLPTLCKRLALWTSSAPSGQLSCLPVVCVRKTKSKHVTFHVANF